jgi:SAM-dependent methyltransferase
MSFTAHNIRFSDDSVTIPDHVQLVAESPRWLRAKRLISMIYGGDVAGRRIVDLGCLEGGFTLEFARLGIDALGIEVRTSNFENCCEVARRASLPNLHFVQDDVWNVEKYGRFDVVFCCGLLYHLDRPRAFLRLMSRCAADAIIVDTHYAQRDGGSNYPLSELVDHEGLRGRWFEEHRIVEATELEALKWASWTNQRSFWPLREALLYAIHDAGFDLVLEQHDIAQDGNLFAHMTSDAYRAAQRGTFVGLRSPSLKPPSDGPMRAGGTQRTS